MKSLLVTGGTTFVSKYTAKYFIEKGYDVSVLNRNTKAQVEGVTLLECDRADLGLLLKNRHFDVVLDITSYNAYDINNLLNALDSFNQYIMISSSAVYPEYETQSFREDTKLAPNKYWGQYGTDKIKAEQALLKRVPSAYVLRPPYLYGPMNNIYREGFVFDCAIRDRKFYLPKKCEMRLQFLYIEDLCRIIERIIQTNPADHILNVGNEETISLKDWVIKCFACFNKTPEFVNIYEDIDQRKYFCFYDYEYKLDVNHQKSLIKHTTSLDEGLKKSAQWYVENESEVNKKPYFEFIENVL